MVWSPFRAKIIIGLLLGAALWWLPEAWRFMAPALSPFLAVCAAMAVPSLSLVLLFALPMLVWLIFQRRFWCRHLCPVGLISELCGKLRAACATAKRKPTPLPSWPVARFLALATLGGSVFGYPLFLWLDPLALFGGFFTIAKVARAGSSPFSAAGIPLLMLVSVLYPGVWCSHICPLGGTQDLLALTTQFWRKTKESPIATETFARGRRVFLGMGAGALFAVLLPRVRVSRRPPLRPPGAVGETAFQGGCIRCGSCSRACPTGIIEPAVEWNAPRGFLAPRIRFQGTNYCRQDCNLCGRVCPTGVIRPLTLTAKNSRAIGLAVIDRPECYLAMEKECGICVARCPRAALVDIFVRETYQSEIMVVPERCNGCGACVGLCPPKVIRVEVVSSGTSCT